jgi:hypothetical protein
MMRVVRRNSGGMSLTAWMTRDGLSPRFTMYVGAVLGGAFWGGAWLLSHEAKDYWCAQRGECRNSPASWVKENLATVFGHLWLVIVVGWLIATIVGAVLWWLGPSRFIRNVGLALIAGPSVGWLVVAWLGLQQLLFGWGMLGGF